VFSLSPISCFVFLRRFRIDPEWQWFRWWTGVAGAIIVASVVVMAAGPTKAPAAPNAFNAWNGAFQRAALIPYLLWTFAFAYGLRRL
jgi:NhaP-type Na+/H+ and K+/H+ antiporter